VSTEEAKKLNRRRAGRFSLLFTIYDLWRAPTPTIPTYFQDGSLLEVNLTQGGDCIDLNTGEAHCSLTFQITGGTGRFLYASGVLTMTETVVTVAADALGNPVFFAATGQFAGTISGVASEDFSNRAKE
jgi:hypothetical protein